MAKSDYTLLVEGEADRGFFEALCRSLGLHPQVEVAPPRRFGAKRDTKQAALHTLPTLLENLVDREDGRVPVILDSDQPEHGGGFERTVEQFSEVVGPYGYQLENAGGASHTGLHFCHEDGLKDVGLWVMPNNADDGMLEHWMAGCLKVDEQPRFDHACQVIDTLPWPAKFKPLRRPKAEIATWLAWQERPGEDLYNAIEAGLLDDTTPLFMGLSEWLGRTFR